MSVSVAPEQGVVRLPYREKVPVGTMKELMQALLNEKLTDFIYDGVKCTEYTKSISEDIRTSLRNLEFGRYKFIVQVVLGERREQGVRVGSKCFWDSNTDNQATASFTNDSVFCVAMAYAVYLY